LLENKAGSRSTGYLAKAGDISQYKVLHRNLEPRSGEVLMKQLHLQLGRSY